MFNIRFFFEKYAQASVSGSPNDIANFYGKNFVGVGPKESMAFANDENFLKWLKNVKEFNAQTGLEQMTVINVVSNTLSKHTILATVTWGAVYKKTKNDIINFDIHYILEKSGTSMKIIMYISDEDQELLMKEKGLVE